MKFLILGSSGKIGKHTTNFLRKNGYDVTEWDIERDESEDLRKYNKDLYTAIDNCDFVLYLASDVGGAKYLEKNQNSIEFISNNMLIMSYTFKALRECKKPFIFTSSQMAELQYSSYGQLKLIGEKIANDIGGLTVRLWNVYSQSSDQTYSDKSHVITDFVYMVKNYNKIKVRTNGEECRQFLYAEDCAECFLTLAKKYNELDKSKNYHITSFEWTSIKDIALTMSKITGCEISFSEKKDSTHMNAMNEPDDYILNFWQPKTSIESGIKMMLGCNK